MRGSRRCSSIFTIIIFMLLGGKMLKNFFDVPDCTKPGSSSAYATIHTPIREYFSTNITMDKAYLSICILCQPDEYFIDDVRNSLLSVVNQIKENTVEIPSYIINIGILAEEENTVREVSEKFQSFSEFKELPLKFISISKSLVEERLKHADVIPSYRLNHNSYIKRRTILHMVLAKLLWYSSQQSQFTLLTDSLITLKENSLENLTRNFDEMKSDPLYFVINLSPIPHIGKLYQSRHLYLYAQFLFHVSPYASIETCVRYYEHFKPSLKQTKQKEFLFHVYKHSMSQLGNPNNPPAMISSNFKVHREYFPSNPYERGELFWTSTPKNNNSLTVKFNHPIKIKSIVIETGKDIYFTDDFTNAVLEEALVLNKNSECKDFRIISDFRAGRINIGLPSYRSTTACLRIRLIAEEKHWIAIRLFRVTSY